VLEEVVAAASELEVGHVGGAMGGPVEDVMAVAPVGGCGAAGFDTAAVADPERATLCGGDEPGAAAEVDHLGTAAHEDAADRGVAGEGLGEGGGDGPGAGELTTVVHEL